jgi:hypothetical protein
MPDTGIDAGDAVVSFLADTTQLDAAFGKLDSIPTRLAPAGAAVEDLGKDLDATGENVENLGENFEETGQTAARSMREARGEMALLGEEVGVRIPRHLRSFVAELPGVGEALTAAFSATAVLMLLQILVSATEKFSTFAANVIYGAEAAKQQQESVVALNNALAPLLTKYQALEEAISKYGKSALQIAEINEGKAKQSVKELTAAIAEDTKEVEKATRAAQNDLIVKMTVSEAYREWRAGTLTVVQALKAMTVGVDEGVAAQAHLGEVQNKLATDTLKLKIAHDEVKVAIHGVGVENDKLAKQLAEADKRFESVVHQLAKAEEEFKKLATVQKAEFEPVMTANVEAVRKLGAALRALGNDNVDLEISAKKAIADMSIINAAYAKGTVSVRQHALAEIAELEALKRLAAARGEDVTSIDKQIHAYQILAGVIEKDKTLMDYFTEDFKKKAKDVGTASQDMAKTLGNAAASMNQAFASAIVGALESGKSIGQALKQATKAILEQLATQALAKSLYYTAEGIAASVTNPAAAAGYFLAAGEFAAVAGTSAAVGMALGGGSGAGPGAGTVGLNSNTGGNINAPGANPTINRMAAGGLISGPTLAILGEGVNGSTNRPQEAVVPLDDDRVMSKLSDKLGTGGGGDAHVHFHKGAGLISPDTLKRTMKQMSGMVKKRTASLHSTNTFRTQKRST